MFIEYVPEYLSIISGSDDALACEAPIMTVS